MTRGLPRGGASAFLAYWRRAERPGERRPDWIAIAVFMVVATVWSHFSARWGALQLPGGGDAPRVDGGVLVGFGPVLGALAAATIRPDPAAKSVGPLGRAPRLAGAALLVPETIAALAGTHYFHVNPHVDAATIMASLVVACLGEELGWREWLYDALGALPLWASVLATWTLWTAWHFAFPPERVGLDRYDVVFVAVLLAMSVALAVVVRATRSSGFAAAWHSLLRAPFPPLAVAAMAVLLGLATWRAARARPISP